MQHTLSGSIDGYPYLNGQASLLRRARASSVTQSINRTVTSAPGMMLRNIFMDQLCTVIHNTLWMSALLDLMPTQFAPVNANSLSCLYRILCEKLSSFHLWLPPEIAVCFVLLGPSHARPSAAPAEPAFMPATAGAIFTLGASEPSWCSGSSPGPFLGTLYPTWPSFSSPSNSPSA